MLCTTEMAGTRQVTLFCDGAMLQADHRLDDEISYLWSPVRT